MDRVNKPLEAELDLPDHSNDDLVDLSQLPKAKSWLTGGSILYQSCWFPSFMLLNVIRFQKEFESRDDDIILTTYPKSGTTWLKSLLFSIINRTKYTPSNSPILTSNPHSLVRFLGFDIYAPDGENRGDQHVINAPSPRLFCTHVPYASLPESIKHSKCKLVYICRNPLDVITSFWTFTVRGLSLAHPEWTLEECVDSFCQGQSIFGPFWDHVLGYWTQSLKRPEKVLFLKYEDMKEDTLSQVKRIAEFVGFPFSEEEEIDKVVEQILELCSLKSLKELDVNKHQKFMPELDNKLFFRKGEVGDWANHLNASMIERVDKLIREKLHGSGLSFRVSNKNSNYNK